MSGALKFASSPPASNDMSRAPVLYKLLSQASYLPCSSGAAAFLSLAQSDNDWFSLTVDVLLPILQDQNIQFSERILATYVLQALYASHDNLKPFHDYLLRVFESERATALAHSRSLQLAGSLKMLRSPQDVTVENEQFVWVIWKILRGEGEDLAPYSSDILSRTTLPEHLRASHLSLPKTQNFGPHSSFDDTHSSVSGISLFPRQSTPSVQTRMPYVEREVSSTSPSPVDSFTQHFAPVSSNMPLSASRSPFRPDEYTDITDFRGERGGAESDLNGSFYESSSRPVYQSSFGKPFEEPSRPDTQTTRYYSDSGSHHGIAPSSFIPSKNHRREALLNALCQEQQTENNFSMRNMNEELIHLSKDTVTRVDKYQNKFDPDNRVTWTGADTMFQSDYRQQQSLQHHLSSPLSVPFPTQQQFPTTKINEFSSLGRRHLNISPSSFTPTATTPPDVVTRPQLSPIASPRPSPSLLYNSDSRRPTPSTIHPNVSSHLYNTTQTYSQSTRIAVANDRLQKPGPGSMRIEFTESVQMPPVNGALQAVRDPGVIGSGRPSSKPKSPLSSDAGEREYLTNVGVIGNGRPARCSPVSRPDAVGEGSVAMIPMWMERTGQRKDQETRRDFGVIGRPKISGRDRDRSERLTGAVGNVDVAPPDDFNDTIFAFSDIPQNRLPEPGEGWDPPRNEDPPFPVGATEPMPAAVSEEGGIPTSTSAASDNVASPEILYPPPPSQISPFIPVSMFPAPMPKGPTRQPENYHTLVATSTNVESANVYHEKERDELSRAILLLLSARERVLTLSEQRVLIPKLPMLTRPLSLLRPGDLHPLVSNNPDMAAKLLVLILDREDEDSARVERVLRDVDRNGLFHTEISQQLSSDTSFISNGMVENIQAAVEFVTHIGSSSSDSAGQCIFSPFGGREAKEGYLDKLKHLPPTMQSFTFMARLLWPTPVAESSQTQDSPEVRVAKLVKDEVLGGFVSACIRWIEKAEEGERNGEVIDDRVAVSVSSLARFYASLVKHGFASTESDVETTEIMSFALQFSRFEEARRLYSMLAVART